ncbi:MAG: hypothetical protein HY063_12165 [Bacteroidetes bacterium]|nr:hypothetical protein [Bacteroidota bacterium]
MKKVFLFSFLIFNFSFLIISCHCKKKTSSATTSSAYSEAELEKIREQQKALYEAGYIRARVVYNEVDGCGYMIQLGDGKKLEPSKKLSEEFKKDGLDVWIKYTPKKGTMSTCMAGEVVDLNDIQLRR